MKLAAVLILYNPQPHVDYIKNNLNIYLDYFSKIYLVDNSPEPTNLFNDVSERIEYIFNNNKGGIAGAQNIGCSRAIADDFEWCMTLDQDSLFQSEELVEYIRLCKEHISEENVSFSLNFIQAEESNLSLAKYIRYRVLSPIKRKLLNLNNLPKAGSINPPDKSKIKDAVSYPLSVIASGNVINLNVWSQIGGFDEVLFIDEVDNDFCFRLIRKGYRIVRFNKVFMYHMIGDNTFCLIRKKLSYHNSFRLYYIFRNHFVIMKRYPEYYDKYKRELIDYLVDNTLKSIHPLKNLRIFYKAYRDSLKIN